MPHAPTLHHRPVVADDAGDDGREPDGWLWILHGIYGSGRNWRSVAQRTVRARPGWGALLVDLREHGGSTGFAPPHTVGSAADDLLEVAGSEDRPPRVLLGHSFGGKVALEYLRRAGEVLDGSAVPEQVWVVDSDPGPGEPSGGAWGLLDILRGHPGPFRSRGEGTHALEDEGLDGAVARWMALNLEEREDGAWVWRIDPDAMEALLRDAFDLDLWPVVESPPGGGEVHLLRATGSSVLSGAALERAEAAAASNDSVHLHEVAAGHWVNADAPEAVVELLSGHLP